MTSVVITLPALVSASSSEEPTELAARSVAVRTLSATSEVPTALAAILAAFTASSLILSVVILDAVAESVRPAPLAPSNAANLRVSYNQT